MAAMIKKVKHVGGYKLQLTFATGETGVIDLTDRIVGRSGAFYAPLQDVNYFAKVKVLPGFWTVVWPNDLDFDPDVLRQAMLEQGAHVPPKYVAQVGRGCLF